MSKKNLQLVRGQVYTPEQREEGLVWSGYADTMIGMKRLENIQRCVEAVLKAGVPGDLIETGAWKGGACILMRATLAAYGVTDRRVFVADSFEGLPKPDPLKYPADKSAKTYADECLSVSQEEAENNFRKYGLLDDQVVFLKGWFKDTLPTAPIEKLAVLRLDGNLYSSTMEALENLYPKLSRGGFCIIDDYRHLPACQQAVDDYRSRHGVKAPIQPIDWTGCFWQKE